MNNTRLVALVIGIGASLALTAPAAHGATIVTANTLGVDGSLPSQNGRVFRDGTNWTCGGAPGLAPEIENEGTTYNYRAHTSRSLLNERVCLRVEITTTCTAAPNQIHSVSYVGTFNPANPLDNFAASPTTVGAGSADYSFYVAPGQQFASVQSLRVTGSSCGSYGLKWSIPGPWAKSRPTTGPGANPAVGTTLTGTDGEWETVPAAPTLTYQWRRCDAAGAACADIPGATAKQYTVADADLGGTLRFRVLATDSGGTNSSDSAPIEPYIPLGGEATGSLGTGDRIQAGFFVRNGVESRCGAPTTVPSVLQAANPFIYDEFTVTSLLNEPACFVFQTRAANCLGGVGAAIHTPPYSGSPATNYAANSGADPAGRSATSAVLPAGGSLVAVAHTIQTGSSCADYRAQLGTTAPFATERPLVSGSPAEGGTLSVTNGAWTGTPAFAYAWFRCDASGGACAPIDGATGTTYVPTAADVGSRVRARVGATQGSQSASADSAPSEVITAAPPRVEQPGPPTGGGPPGVPPADSLAPRASLKLKSADARRALRRSRLPVAATCNERCSITVELKITSKLAKKYRLGKRVVIGTAKGNLTAGRGRTLTVKLSSLAKKRLKNVRSLRVSIVATARDTAGNRGTASAKATLKRSR